MNKLTVALFLLVQSTVARAGPITFDFEGTLTSASGIFAGQGTEVTGQFSFDDQLVDSAAGGISDRFRTNSVNNVSLLSTWTASLNLGTTTVFSTAISTSSVTDAALDLDDTDSGVYDNIFYSITGPSGEGGGGLNFFLALQGNNMIDPGVSTLTSSIGGAIGVLNSLDFGRVDATFGQWIEWDENSQSLGSLFFSVDSLSIAGDPAEIPEPGTLGLLALGYAAMRIARSRKKVGSCWEKRTNTAKFGRFQSAVTGGS